MDCESEPDDGYCRAAFERYYFDKIENTCKTFIYGGCGGNDNRYPTKKNCFDACSSKGELQWYEIVCTVVIVSVNQSPLHERK